MKGFGIHVKNDLLDPKHQKAMGRAVWLYMWCLDRMTKIDEGKGFVLGGKPIIESEVTEELGISRPTYFRWLDVLRHHEYITTVHTPQGLTIVVHKAVKPSIQRVIKSDKSELSKVITRVIKSDNSNIRHIKDVSVRQEKSLKRLKEMKKKRGLI